MKNFCFILLNILLITKTSSMHSNQVKEYHFVEYDQRQRNEKRVRINPIYDYVLAINDNDVFIDNQSKHRLFIVKFLSCKLIDYETLDTIAPESIYTNSSYTSLHIKPIDKSKIAIMVENVNSYCLIPNKPNISIQALNEIPKENKKLIKNHPNISIFFAYINLRKYYLTQIRRKTIPVYEIGDDIDLNIKQYIHPSKKQAPDEKWIADKELEFNAPNTTASQTTSNQHKRYNPYGIMKLKKPSSQNSSNNNNTKDQKEIADEDKDLTRRMKMLSDKFINWNPNSEKYNNS